MSGHHSRRNSMTSLATANTTASSQNNISGHDLSTDNLIAVDSKFVKKPTKKFPNSNGLSPKLINDSTLRSGGGNNNNNNNSSGSAFYAKEGVYYFPNGEVFRPRTTPAKRNRPSKLQQDISPNDSGNSSPVVPPLNPNTSSESPTSQHSSNSSTNSGTASSMVAPSLHSNNSHSSLPKSASIHNVKMMNKQNLVQNIRNSRGDITTNIVLEDNSAKIPYENYRNSNSSSSLKNSHKFQSQNITKTEQYSNTSSFSSQTSNASNVSDLLADHDDEHSNAHLNRSATNTPSTSISDDHNRLSNEIRNSTGSSSDEGNHPPETVTDDTALSTLNETSEETFKSVPTANLGSSSAGNSANSSWDNKGTPEPHRLARNESNSSFSPSERQHALRTRSMQHQPVSTSSPASSSPHLTIGTDSPSSGYGNTPSSAYGNTPSSGYGQTPSSGYGHTPSSVYDSIAPLEVVKQRAPNNSGSNSPNSLYDSSNPASIHRLGAPMKPILRDISRTSELSSEEEVFRTPVSTPDKEVFREFKGTPTMTPTSPTSVKTATPIITPPSNINTFRPPRISAGSLLHFERSNTDTSSSTNSSSSGGTSNRKSQISLLPEPTIDTESFVEQYFNESSPESYQLSEIISNLNSTPTKQHHQQQQQLLEREKMAHEQEEYTKHINEKRQSFQLSHQSHVPPKEQVIQVTDEQAIKFVPSPSNSKTDTPRSSRYYDIDSSTFNKFVNDTQMDIPPRGDVMIVSNKKIRKHSRNASSTSSANDFFINSANNSQTAANTSANPGPSTPKRSPIQEVITPQNPESPPPPPPIEKSPGMRVKGRPKKRRPRKDGEHKSDKKNVDETHHATRSENKPRDQDEEVNQRKGSDHTHKVESEEFTIPIAIQTQPIKRKNTEQPVTPVLAVAPNSIFKNEDEERDPSPSKSVLYDTPRTLQEQQAQEMRELEEKNQPPKAPEPTTPVKKSAKPIRSLLLNDESIQDKKLPMGPNFKPPNTAKTVKKTSSMPSMGPEKPPLIPDASLPSSDKQHQSSTTHRRFEPSRPPPEINDKNRLAASKTHQPIGKAPPPPSSSSATTPAPAPAPATTTSRPRIESSLAIPHPPPPPPLQPPTAQPQAQSPQPNMKRHVYHSPKLGDDSNNKKGAGGSSTNLKSFFKMFKPHSQEKSMDKSNSTTSLSSSGSGSSKLFKFMKPKKEEQDMTDLPIIVEQSKLGPPVAATTNGNRISVLSEIAPSIKLGSLPDFEPEETGLFDELMMTFDEKFESGLTPTSPPAFIHKISTNRSSMNEPFLRDDELSIDQIKDQQLKDDDAANNGGTGTIGGYSININDENYAENLAFLKSEAYWATMDEGAIKNHIDENSYTIDEETNPEIRKFREGLMAAANVVPPPDISMTSSEAGISTPVDDSFLQPAVGPPQIPRAPNAPVTDEDIDPVLVDDDLSQEGESIVIDNQELHYIFNNLTDDEKRNLPPHLKYIRQFKDYQSIEVNMKKFEDLSKVEFSVDEDGKSGPILKRRRRGGNGKKSMLDSGNGSRRVVFSNKISINETFASDMYKRYNKAVTQYSLNDPKEINKIKNELNYYKCNEMLVHESSQNNTHFFY